MCVTQGILGKWIGLVAGAGLVLAACGGTATGSASVGSGASSSASTIASAASVSASVSPSSSAGSPAASAAVVSASAQPSSGAAATSGSPVASGNLKKLKVGGLPTLGEAPFIIAQQKGYFAQEGLEVDLVPFSSGAAVVAPLATGQLDAAQSIAPSVGLFNAEGRDVTLKIVADNGSIEKNRNIGQLIISKKYQPVAGQYADLSTLPRPVKASSTAEGILPDAIVHLQLEAAGVKESDIQTNFLGLPDMNVAFKNNNIDFAGSGEPLITIGVQQGLYVRWKPMADLYPHMPYSNVMYGPNLLQKDKAAGDALMRGYLRGVRDYEDAFSKGKDTQAIINMIGPPLKITADLFDGMQKGGGLAYFNPDGSVNAQPLQPILAYWQKTGVVAKDFDLNTLVDNSVAVAAVAKLGKYSA